MKNKRWIIKIILLSFFLAIIFSGITNVIGNYGNMISLIIITLVVIIIGIMFDAVGTSVLTSKESTFHAKAAKKIKGAKETVYLLRNSSIIANICNDVVGDICGIISGGLGTVLAINICLKYSLNQTVTTMIVSAVISSITIGSKAAGKTIAEKYDEKIIFSVGKLMSTFKKEK